MSHKIVIDELNNVVQITAPGPQGVQGPAGTTLRYGAGAPTAGDGNNGDFWVDTTNDRLYGPKAAGAWPAEYTSLIGPANTLTIGTVTTGPTNGTAAASISGTAPNQVLDLTLPAGPTGPAINLGSALPLPLGATALAGTATSGSREDHVHASAGVTVTLLQAYVKNGSGGALSKGDAVYISGSDGSNVLISKADANSDPSSSKTLGLLSQDLAINALGYVTTEGLVSGINTASATAGQSVWLSTTAGQWVFGSPPAEPAHGVYLGVVARANANNGEILVKVQNGYELDELHDVFAGSPTNGHLLRYDASSTAWINGQALGTSIAAGAISGTHIAVGAVGSTQIASTAVIASKIGSEAAGTGSVLIANGAGGASWGVSVDPEIGTFGTTTVTFNFGTPNDNTGSYIGSSQSANGATWGVGGAGSVVLRGSILNAAATSKNWNTWVISSHASSGTITPIGTASVSASPAGTISSGGIKGLRGHFAGGTSVYWTEAWNLTTSGSAYWSMRKYNQTLAASQWNAVIWNTGTNFPSSISDLINNASSAVPKFASGINAWIGVLYNTSNASSTAEVFHINDTSGSVLKAQFAVNSSPDRWSISDIVYVPPSGAGNGTVWAAGSTDAGLRRRVAFTASSATLTAASTADNWTPTGSASGLNALYWDSTISKIIWRSGSTYYGLERTFGTVEFTSSGVLVDERIGDWGVGEKGTTALGRFTAGTGTAGYAPVSTSPATDDPIPFISSGTLAAYISTSNGEIVGTASSYSINRQRYDFEPTFGSVNYGRLVYNTTAGVTVSRNTGDLVQLSGGASIGDGFQQYLPAGGSAGIHATSAGSGTVTQTFYTIRLK